MPASESSRVESVVVLMWEVINTELEIRTSRSISNETCMGGRSAPRRSRGEVHHSEYTRPR